VFFGARDVQALYRVVAEERRIRRIERIPQVPRKQLPLLLFVRTKLDVFVHAPHSTR